MGPEELAQAWDEGVSAGMDAMRDAIHWGDSTARAPRNPYRTANAVQGDAIAEYVAEREAQAWDACVAAATGGGLTPLAQMLRDDNPYRKGGEE